MIPAATILLQGVRDVIDEVLPHLLECRHDIYWKPDGSPVTQADKFLEKLIAGWLSERLPALHFIGEESFDPDTAVLPQEGWIAVLDPVDGTENFCSGLKEWGVSLSLWFGKEHAGSLLALPELGDSMMTGEPITRVPSRITGYSSSTHPTIASEILKGGEARIFGCAVYNMYNVTRGALARFVNPKGAHSWDLLAGLMLAREHGCEIWVDDKPYEGSFLEPDRRYRVDIRHRYDLHSGQGPVG